MVFFDSLKRIADALEVEISDLFERKKRGRKYYNLS